MDAVQITVDIKIFDFDSDNYQRELELRDEVLRKPLGMNLYDENLDKDEPDIHIGAFLNQKMIGVLLLSKVNHSHLKMRQVAVFDKFQGLKVGTQMVCFAEEFSKQNGYVVMELNARKTAVQFYEKLGYKIKGGEFLEINIPHFKMEKYI